MSLTFEQALYYTNDKLQIGLVEKLVKDDPILKVLPWETVKGQGLTYNEETTMPNVEFVDSNEEIEESTETHTPHTVIPKQMGGFFDVDRFEAKLASQDQDIETRQANAKMKAAKWKFMDQFYYGTDAKGFTGLQSLISSTTYNTVHAGSATGTTGTALSIAKLRTAMDLVKGVVPGMIVMSKAMRNLITVYLDGIGAPWQSTRDNFGIPCNYFNTIPVYTSDFILNTETVSSGAYAAKTGGYNTTIYILSMSEAPETLCGIAADSILPTVEPWGKNPKKNADRYLLIWYPAIMLQKIITCAKVDGILSTGAVTA
jgi:hypothetical protein